MYDKNWKERVNTLNTLLIKYSFDVSISDKIYLYKFLFLVLFLIDKKAR